MGVLATTPPPPPKGLRHFPSTLSINTGEEAIIPQVNLNMVHEFLSFSFFNTAGRENARSSVMATKTPQDSLMWEERGRWVECWNAPFSSYNNVTAAKTAFCFDYGAHLLWHCFDNLMQCHNIYFHPELHSFLAKILYWWQESRTIPSVFSSTSQRLSMGLKSGLCGGQFMCENDSSCSLTLMCPHAPLFHN